MNALPARKFPEGFYTHFIYLHDEEPLHIQELIMDDERIAGYFEKSQSVTFHSRAYSPPRNRLPQTTQDVKMTIEWEDGDTEVITLAEATYDGAINLHTVKEMTNLAAGAMDRGDDQIYWEATVWRAKPDVMIRARDVDRIRSAMDKDNLDFDLSEMGVSRE